MADFISYSVNYMGLGNLNEAMKENLNSRDPCGINRDIKVNMEDVIAEPESLRSPNVVWMLNYYCYQIVKMVCYVLLAVILGPFLSLIFGACFAVLSFIHIWTCMPVFRILKFGFGWVKRYVSVSVDTVVVPCVHGLGHIFSNVRIYHQKLVNKETTEDEILLL